MKITIKKITPVLHIHLRLRQCNRSHLPFHRAIVLNRSQLRILWTCRDSETIATMAHQIHRASTITILTNNVSSSKSANPFNRECLNSRKEKLFRVSHLRLRVAIPAVTRNHSNNACSITRKTSQICNIVLVLLQMLMACWLLNSVSPRNRIQRAPWNLTLPTVASVHSILLLLRTQWLLQIHQSTVRIFPHSTHMDQVVAVWTSCHHRIQQIQSSQWAVSTVEDQTTLNSLKTMSIDTKRQHQLLINTCTIHSETETMDSKEWCKRDSNNRINSSNNDPCSRELCSVATNSNTIRIRDKLNSNSTWIRTILRETWTSNPHSSTNKITINTTAKPSINRFPRANATDTPSQTVRFHRVAHRKSTRTNC